MVGVQAWVSDGTDKPGPSAEGWRPMSDRMAGRGGWTKPQSGGLWTSTWDGASSDWMHWCLGESYGGPSFDVWLLKPDPTARIFTVDTQDDLRELVKAYPAGPSPYESMQDRWKYPSWEAVALDYDAVNLTEEGQWRTRLPESGPDLYGWDCESTLWFRWCFTDVTPLGTITPVHARVEA